MSRHLSIHATVPILEILASPKDLMELFEFLDLNNAHISLYDKTFQKSPEVVSVNNGVLYAFIEVGPGEKRKASFYEDHTQISSIFLKIVLNWIRKKGLRILRSRISSL
ncbi:MAG: hypothetical protein ACFFB3_02110 [Candidatus Hodarchaeota archaeon]